MRKLTALVLILLLLAAVAVPAAATDYASMTITAGTATAYRGDTITFTVRMSAVDDCRSGGIRLSYNSAVFELVTGSCTVDGAYLKEFSGGTGSFAFSSGTTASGTVFTFALRVKSDAPFGSYTVSGTGSVRNSGGNITTGVNGASVTIACKHSYSGWTTTGDAEHTHSCTVCGDTATEAHNWDSVVIDQAATCISTGQKTLTCTACGQSQTQQIPVSSQHSYSGWTRVNDGYHSGTCTVCGQSTTVGHYWSDIKVLKEATCVEAGEAIYTCGSCGFSKNQVLDATGEHTYDHGCDTDCNVCGKTRTTSHKFADKWSTDAQNHYHICEHCGEKADITAHTPSNGPTATKPQECTVCGFILKAALNHKHDLQEGWKSDGYQHWRECNDCTEYVQLQEHSFENSCDDLCEVCGYTRNAGHTVSDKCEADATGHYFLCGVCNAHLEFAAHTPGPAATEFEDQTCTVCGYVMTPALGHRYASFWSYDGENHYHACDCGDKTQIQAHTWKHTGARTGLAVYHCSVCGAEQVRLNLLDWGLLALMLVPLALGGAIGAVITLLLKRRRR